MMECDTKEETELKPRAYHRRSQSTALKRNCSSSYDKYFRVEFQHDDDDVKQ